MRKVGDVVPTKIWGPYTIEQIVEPEKPIRFYKEGIGEFFFNPQILKIRWNEHPDFDEEQLMFPYWTRKESDPLDFWHYGVRSFPQMDEATYAELLLKAVNQDFFSENFLRQLGKTIQTKLEESND